MKTLLFFPLLLCLALANCATQNQTDAQNLAAQFLKKAASDATIVAAEAGLLVAHAKLAEAEANLASYRTTLGSQPKAQELAQLQVYERALTSARDLHSKLALQVTKLRGLPEAPAGTELPELIIIPK